MPITPASPTGRHVAIGDKIVAVPRRLGSTLMIAGRFVWRLPGRARRLLRDLQLPAAAALSAVGLAALGLFVLWLTGRPKGGDLKFWYIEEMAWKDRLTYAAAVATGAGALVALVVAYRKQRDAEEGKFAAQFAAAAAQLGDDAPAVRIAGAYAIAALADRHKERRQQCVDVLTGYLRLPYDPHDGHRTARTVERTMDVEGDQATVTDTSTFRPADREVRLTIIRIIRDHLQDPTSSTTWCSHYLSFDGATFDGGSFDGAKFSGGVVSFVGAKFSGGVVSFVGAKFSGGVVNFVGAKFSGGVVSFVGVEFSGGVVYFDGAEFSGGVVSFVGAVFSRGGVVRFEGAKFSGGVVRFDGAGFSRGGVVRFDGAEFSGGAVNFDGAKFSGGVVSFDGAGFSLGGVVRFDLAKFSGGQVSFDRARFSGGAVSFDRARFSGGAVSFVEAAFSGGAVSFDYAKFVGGTVAIGGKAFRGWRDGAFIENPVQ